MKYISTFSGYFPADYPKYSCIVVIHKPDKKKGYYGSQVAAPVFKEIAKKIYNSTPKLRVFDIKKSNKNYQKSLKIEGLDGIPDLKGLPAMDAISLLENMGLKVVLKGTVSKSEYDGYFIKVENNREIYISNIEIKSVQFIKNPTAINTQSLSIKKRFFSPPVIDHDTGSLAVKILISVLFSSVEA